MNGGDSQDLNSVRAPAQVPNVVLTGFMGTGKTRIGREVARCLGRPFVDMDAEIEARAGKSIPRIFAEEGEAAFRRMEAGLCQELGGRRGFVIATGGGALLGPANRTVMMRNGVVICLTASAGEIHSRLSGGDAVDRPLLDVPDPLAEVERLLALRKDAYDAIPWQVDTTGLSVDKVVERVIRFADTVTLGVSHPGGAYPIYIGDGLLSHVGTALRASGGIAGSHVAVVSNPVVEPLCGAQVEASLSAAGYQPVACIIPDGEQHKTLDTVSELYDRFLEGGLDRSGGVISLGGGVTGDIAGFAAATFMRGVPFVQVPTTVLSMVDASVGGKVGVDLPQGKNLAGAFKQPVLVVIDPGVLATLPVEEVRSGMSEAIKHGIIGAPDLFAGLESGPSGAQSGMSVSQLAQALKVKIRIVEDDPFEHGHRAVLNLGHTVAHALERLSWFSLRHGEAVAIGMVAAARISTELGRASESLPARIEAALAAWSLPVQCPPFDVAEIWGAMAFDKKRRGSTLRWVLPHAIGHVEVADDLPRQVVTSVLTSMGARREE
jgi:shikimate kinase / 3-dehydroquinate synthase